MIRRLLLCAAAMLLLAGPSTAKADDFGIWYSAGLEKKLTKKWSLGLEGEFRTRNDARTADRWSIGLSADYKINKWLKASAGYVYLYDHFSEKITYLEDGSLNGWRPSYWGSRHRFHVSVTGKLGIGRLDLSLRERWQYTYRPEATTRRYDFQDAEWDYNRVVSGKGQNLLRSRLQVDYNIPKSKLAPYANVEFYNAWALQKTRITAGLDWKINKKNSVGVAYRLQIAGSGSSEPNEHILSLSYKFKL